MKKIFHIALTVIALASTTSCEREKLEYDFLPEENSGKTGTLDLSTFGAVPNDIDKVPQNIPSRAVDTQDFTVQIFSTLNETETMESSWKYSDLPEIVTMKVGDYKLKVFSHNVQDAEWEKPYYYADKGFSIEENRVTQIDTVVCTLQNIKVTVSFSEDLKTLMADNCKVSVTIGSGLLEYGKEETRAGYFKAASESNQLIALFSGEIDGAQETSRIQVSDVKAGEWRKINFDIKRPDVGSESGTLSPSIRLEASVEAVDHEGNVSVDEEVITDPNPIPGGDDEEDPNNPDNPDPDDPVVPPTTNAPKITSETLELGKPVTVTDGLQVVVDITSSDENGLTELYVDIESDELNDDLLEEMELSTHLDLVTPGSMKAKIEELGFPTEDKVLNQQKVTFDITKFMPMLKGLGACEHKFIITATDAQGSTTEKLILVIAQ